MAVELLLMRCGLAASADGSPDHRRPLRKQGKLDAQRMGVYLAGRDLAPDTILSSTAERASNTAHKTCKAMGSGAALVQRDPRLWESSGEDLLELLRDLPPRVRRAMLVAHSPAVSWLLQHLPEPGLAEGLVPAGLARLAFDGGWPELAPGSARLLERVEPAQLPDKFPYPGPGGGEWRDRPAYYYTQSSVIPYRLGPGGLQLLLVGSSGRKHWVVPKGIHDPGCSAQVSAAKEAREEAGVEGDVDPEPLGTYEVEKWGGTCTVTVYPMRVTRELPESRWEEPHRGREWVDPDTAAARLGRPGLAPMIERLVGRLEADEEPG